jgi:thymidine kinase
MSLTLYVGPMFAGKSSTVLGIIRRNTVIGRRTFVITSHLDTRYKQDAITSHDLESYPAVSAKELLMLPQSREYEEASCVIIEEAQFFADLKAFVLTAVERDQKEVIMMGLDGDSARKPFGQVLDLIPYCDAVHKLTALCGNCGDGTAALFTHRKSCAASKEQVNVGTSDQYEPLCRRHYLEASTVEKVERYIQRALTDRLSPEKEVERCIRYFGIERGTEIFTEIVTRRYRAGSNVHVTFLKSPALK